jgi:Tol biopolymer transport system component
MSGTVDERPLAWWMTAAARHGLAIGSVAIVLAAVASFVPGGRASGRPVSLDASAPRPSGVLAYVGDSDYYGSNGKETLLSVAPDGDHPRTLLRPADVGMGLLEFSPSGRRLAYFRDSTSGARVYVMDVATRRAVPVFTLRGTSAYVDGLTWTSDGRALVLGTNERPGSSEAHSQTALWRIPLAGGKPRRLTPFDDAGDPATLPDGGLVYVVSKTFSSSSLKKSALWTSRPDGSHASRLFASPHFVDGPDAAPDGRLVAFSLVVTDTTSHLESFTMASHRRTNLTPPVGGRTDVSPFFSPTGREIVFLSSRAGRYASTTSHQLLDVYAMKVSGGRPKKVIGRKGNEWSAILVTWGDQAAS